MEGAVFLTFAVVLVCDVMIGVGAWLFVDNFWNKIVRKELQVKGNTAWTYLLVSVILLINAAAITRLANTILLYAP